MKKRLRGLLVILVIAAIFYLTLQTPSQTMDLSEGFRAWLKAHGIVIDSPYLRSWAHLPMYFILGFTLCLWGGWKKALWIGPLIGTIDEALKIILPTRHFDFFDLCLDYLGVALGALAVCLLRKLLHRIKASHQDAGPSQIRTPDPFQKP